MFDQNDFANQFLMSAYAWLDIWGAQNVMFSCFALIVIKESWHLGSTTNCVSMVLANNFLILYCTF